MRRAAVLVGLFILLFTAAPVVGEAGPLGLLGVGRDRTAASSAGSMSSGAARGSFSSQCKYSHRLGDDPIVYPGRAGASHSHDFFGNKSTNASSTYASMRAARTTCHRSDDAAGYWVPTLYSGGRAVQPVRASAYYQSIAANPKMIRAYPANLRVLAGNSSAGPPRTRATYWDCGEHVGVGPSSMPPWCPEGTQLRVHILFPDCWNGTSVDSADHRSHMAYSRDGQCPSTHQVPVPRLRLNVVYPIRGGSNLNLSSGSPTTAHADFFNTWNQAELERLVRVCSQASRNCDMGG